MNYFQLMEDAFALKPGLTKPFSRRTLTRNGGICDYRIIQGQKVSKAGQSCQSYTDHNMNAAASRGEPDEQLAAGKVGNERKLAKEQ